MKVTVFLLIDGATAEYLLQAIIQGREERKYLITKHTMAFHGGCYVRPTMVVAIVTLQLMRKAPHLRGIQFTLLAAIVIFALRCG
mgnify:CR=1 FL=1